MPTNATISPVISGGKRKRRRLINLEKRASNIPAIAVIPITRLKPPVFAARMDAVKKEGPQS
jgi:hypothetical protein